MNRNSRSIILPVLLLLFSSCNNHEDKYYVHPFFKQNTLLFTNPAENRIDPQGKDKLAEPLDHIFKYAHFDSMPLPPIEPELVEGLHHQLKLLKLRKQKPVQQIDNLEVTIEDMRTVIKLLLAGQFSQIGLDQRLEAFQLAGDDSRGNVYYTGYFTPVLKVRKKPNNTYKYPIYSKPEIKSVILPSRKEIDGDLVLADQGLELAYTKNKIDLYFMHVQGSGIVQYRNGVKELYSYGGGNGHPYRSIGRYMVESDFNYTASVSIQSLKKYFNEHPEQADEVLFANPNYIFFKPSINKPKGAGHVPLTANYSIAVDRKYIPLGSCLLAQVPIIGENKKFSHYEFRFLIAQDVGGAINGPGHVDLYQGIGKTGRKNASALHHYGKLWLLLPKKELAAQIE